MTFTQLRNRKADAYDVDLRLEPRERILDTSPKACCWDLHGKRLLFARDVWRYRVYAGTEDVYDPGFIDTEIVALPAAQLPMTSAAQGNLLVRLDRVDTTLIPREIWPPYTSLRVVEALAADAETGQWVVYSSRDDVQTPYRTELAAYDNAGGALGGTVSLEQPLDGTARWRVPHAIFEKGWVYAIERDLTFQETPGPAPGHVTKRHVGTLGSLIFRWTPLDRYVYPHSVSVGHGDILWVAMNKLFDPGTDFAIQRTYMGCLDRTAMGALFIAELNFGLDPDTHYWLGEWQGSGELNTGGLVLFDSATVDSSLFIASGTTPAGFDPEHPEQKLFRFELAPPGVHVADLGDAMPIPMSRTPTGLVGNTVGVLPELRNE